MFFFLSLAVYAEETQEEEEEYKKREFEVGLRSGIGHKPEDRFETQLKNYRTLTGPNIYAQTSLSSFDRTSNLEFLFRIRLSSNSKAGFNYGNAFYNDFKFNEVNNLQLVTAINYRLKVDYFQLGYIHEFYFRKFYIEAGFGMGVNTVSLDSGGYTGFPGGYSKVDGFMVGNGLSYRLETSINKKITDLLVLQGGVMYNYFTVPSFNGRINESAGSLYLRSDGTISAFTQGEYRDSFVTSEYAVRRLDARIGNIVFFFSVLLKISL